MIRWRGSPNSGARRLGAVPDMVVLHYTAMASAGAAEDRLCDPAFEVSAHYLIGREGAVVQMVDERARAWHAGAGQWGGVKDVNSRSIGIELDNDGRSRFPDDQMTSLETLLQGVLDRWSIRPERVIGHSDMAPLRKADPGPRFDWARLARAGLSVWPEASGSASADVRVFRDGAVAFGYAPSIDHETLLAAFRLRFRPGGMGDLTAWDTAAAIDLGRRFPVDQQAGPA